MDGRRGEKRFLWSSAAAVALLLGLVRPLLALRPLRERNSAASTGPWGDERLFLRRYESDLNPYSAWNITGTYRGRWNFVETTNSSSRLFDFGKSNGVSVRELVSTPTKISGVHYVQSLFNAFATAAFFKFVVFSIFEMRYLLAIWKARRPMNSGEGGENMRRELSVLYSRFCNAGLCGVPGLPACGPHLSAAAKVGIAFGALFSLLLVLVVLLILWKRRENVLRTQKIAAAAAREAPYAKARTHFGRDVQMAKHHHHHHHQQQEAQNHTESASNLVA